MGSASQGTMEVMRDEWVWGHCGTCSYWVQCGGGEQPANRKLSCSPYNVFTIGGGGAMVVILKYGIENYQSIWNASHSPLGLFNASSYVCLRVLLRSQEIGGFEGWVELVDYRVSWRGWSSLPTRTLPADQLSGLIWVRQEPLGCPSFRV